MSESMIVGGVDLGDENLDLPPGTSDAVNNLQNALQAILDDHQECRHRWEERGKKIEHQRRELARLNREHLQDLATIQGQNIGLTALESTNAKLRLRIGDLEEALAEAKHQNSIDRGHQSDWRDAARKESAKAVALIEKLYAQIAVLETELGYPTPELTGKHAANRHAEGPRTGAQSQGGKLHQCDSRATQDTQQCDHTPADQLIHPVVDGTCGKCWQVIDALKPHHEALNNPIPDWERELLKTGQDLIPDAAIKAATSVKIVDWLAEPLHLAEDEARDVLEAAIPEIRRQLAALIRARIDEDAAGKIHNDPATYNRGIGVNIGLIRAARIVEGRQR